MSVSINVSEWGWRLTPKLNEKGEGVDGADGTAAAAASRSIGFANVPEPSLEKNIFPRRKNC